MKIIICLSVLLVIFSFAQLLVKGQQSQSKPRILLPNFMILRTELKGFGKGSAFDYSKPYETQTLRKINLGCGADVDSIALEYSDGLRNYSTPLVGGSGGKQIEWQIPSGEYVANVTMEIEQYLRAIRFTTNKGNQSPDCGVYNSSTVSLISFMKGYAIAGLFGASGQGRIRRLGFNMASDD